MRGAQRDIAQPGMPRWPGPRFLTVRVRSPDGRKWRVGRRWLPHRPRVGRIDVPDVGDLGPLGLAGFDPTGVLATIALSILAVVAGVLLVLVLFNVVAIAIELAILV